MPIFNGTYTLESSKTGQHRTFKISTQKADAKFAPGSRVVSLLNGPDNESNYQGFAFLGSDDVMHVWQKKRGEYQPGTPGQPQPRVKIYNPSQYEVYASMLCDMLTNPDSVWIKERGYSVHKSCTCIQCNRKLTTPDSIKCGIGEVCAERLGVDRSALVEAFDRAAKAADSAVRSPDRAPVAGSKPAIPQITGPAKKNAISAPLVQSTMRFDQ